MRQEEYKFPIIFSLFMGDEEVRIRRFWFGFSGYSTGGSLLSPQTQEFSEEKSS